MQLEIHSRRSLKMCKCLTMNKVCVIAPANLKYVPYYKYYTDILDASGICYDIISWDRAGIEEKVSFSMKYPAKDFDRKRMLWGYLKFGQFCRRIISKQQYEKIIFLTVAPVFFCGPFLLNKYKGKYWLDIRDYSPIVHYFPWCFEAICRNAWKIVVSSPSFNSWIKAPTIICHNADVNQIKNSAGLYVKRPEHADSLRIVFAGMMIEEDINIRVLDCYKNSEKICFSFIGRDIEGKQKIETFVKKNGINNVLFEGAYKKEDIIEIYREKADFVNIFRANTIINKNALPNKLYDAVISGVPVIVFDHNEAIVSFVEKYNLGIVMNEAQIGMLPELMNSFDFSAYEVGRKQFLEQVIEDMASFKKTLLSYVAK